MILNQLPTDISLTARIEHLDEMIGMFRGYIQKKPEHTEYYNSVIIHLQALREGYVITLQDYTGGNHAH